MMFVIVIMMMVKEYRNYILKKTVLLTICLPQIAPRIFVRVNLGLFLQDGDCVAVLNFGTTNCVVHLHEFWNEIPSVASPL